MKDWMMKFFETLAGKLTAILAFAVLVIALLALWGDRIPSDYRLLVYVVAILAMMIFMAQVIVRHKKSISSNQKIEAGGHVEESIQVIGNRNQITQIIHNYANTHAGVDQNDLQCQINEYLDWMQETYGFITLRGIEKGGSQVVTMPLETVYVPLQAEREINFREDIVVAEFKGKPSKLRMEEHSIEANALRLDEVLSFGNRIIITGGPGCGKTTVLQHIAWTLAATLQGNAGLAREKLGLPGVIPVPIFVPLSLYARYLRSLVASVPASQKSLAYYISEYLIQRQTNLNLPPEFLTHLFRSENCVLLLLDGLDEVPNEDERGQVRQAIEDLTAGRENMRVVVTSRTAAYHGQSVLGRGFQHIRVLPLQIEQVESLVRQAYAAIHAQSQQKAKTQADNLLTEIEKLEAERRRRLGDDVESFVDSPLMVRMLLIVHVNDKHLPDQRADMYKKAVDAILRPDYNEDGNVVKELETRIGGSLAMNRDMLQFLAFKMHTQGEKQGREVDEKTIRQVFNAEETYAPYVAELLAQTCERGTLLEERGGLYRFMHLSFQEFLTGRYMAQVLHDPDKIAAFLENGLVLDSWWREPILLMFGYLDVDSPNMLPKVLTRLAGMDTQAKNRKTPVFNVRLACTELAATAFLECKNQYAGLGERLTRRLQDLHDESTNRLWKPVLLASAMDALDRLGYCPSDLHIFVAINLPEQFSTLHSSFCISKYPVTNIQYERFLKPANFADKSLWAGFRKFSEPDKKGNIREIGDWGNEAWDWLQSALKSGEYVENGMLQPRFWRDPRFGISRRNAPVVGVSWYEANAYCQWLLENWDTLEEGKQGLPKPKEIRLPTEAEWRLAAGGEQDDHFAWGMLKNDKEITRFANTSESGINRTNPVWMYPQGESPLGVMDLSGNVWEWQANFIDKDHDWLALRGGSWYDSQVFARVSDRFYDHPIVRDGHIGFRMAAFPS